MAPKDVVSTIVNPVGTMTVLSAREVSQLQDTSQSGLHKLFRQCALAVLNCEQESDSAEELLGEYDTFDIRIVQEHRGLKLELIDAPASAFVQGKLIRGVRENLFSVLRDILYVASQDYAALNTSGKKNEATTDQIFQILRNAPRHASQGTTQYCGLLGRPFNSAGRI